MKKIVPFFFFFSLITYAQDTHFGPQLGFQFYDITLDGTLSAGAAYSGLNFGAFVDHKITDNLGFKGSITYCKITEDHYEFISDGLATNIFDQSKLSVLQFQALMKLDVNRTYRKGFFLAGGLRLNSIMSTSIDDAPDYSNDFYNKNTIAALLGFGSSLSKYASFELLFDYGLSNTVESAASKGSTIGFIANLNIDVSAIVK